MCRRRIAITGLNASAELRFASPVIQSTARLPRPAMFWNPGSSSVESTSVSDCMTAVPSRPRVWSESACNRRNALRPFREPGPLFVRIHRGAHLKGSRLTDQAVSYSAEARHRGRRCAIFTARPAARLHQRPARRPHRYCDRTARPAAALSASRQHAVRCLGRLMQKPWESASVMRRCS